MDYYASLFASKVSGGGGGGSGEWTSDGIAQGLEPNGVIILGSDVTSIANSAFQNNTKITKIVGENVTTLGLDVLRGCSALTEAYFPQMTSNVPLYTFGGCSSLTTADLGKTGQVNNNSFNGAGALRTIILRRTSVPTLQSWSVGTLGGIYSNPTQSTIYVPESLIASYQTSGNWVSAYNAGVTFAKIEGSIYE